MLELKQLHHIAIICKDYEKSKRFYTEVLGFRIKQEIYRAPRESYKLDLCLGDDYLIELFSFPNPANRPSRPEASGLRHIAFAVQSVEASVAILEQLGLSYDPIRIDEFTGKKFTFFTDPDDLPIELYEL